MVNGGVIPTEEGTGELISSLDLTSAERDEILSLVSPAVREELLKCLPSLKTESNE
jgi:hypothetical protein